MIRISENYALLEEKRYVIETLNHQDIYKKVIEEIWANRVKLEGQVKKKDKNAFIYNYYY